MNHFYLFVTESLQKFMLKELDLFQHHHIIISILNLLYHILSTVFLKFAEKTKHQRRIFESHKFDQNPKFIKLPIMICAMHHEFNVWCRPKQRMY